MIINAKPKIAKIVYTYSSWMILTLHLTLHLYIHML